MSLEILALRADLLNVNGDAENARVLAVRAEWAGLDARIVSTSTGLPAAVVIGSGYDGDAAGIVDALREHRDLLSDCIASGVPVLAVAMGLELLGDRIEIAKGEWVRGLQLVEGEAALVANRMAGDLVVESEFGTLVGFENHTRSWIGEAPTLGEVIVGHGNGTPSRVEGLVHGSVIGTHIRGPVLARNPVLADHILRRASAGRYTERGPAAHAADRIAETSRAKTLTTRIGR
jgi:CobQ-like glutamine amidotransferase family enzyme